MSIGEVKDKSRIAPLFEGWQETMIWSCLQDCMGRAFADSGKKPEAAMIFNADFCFLAGKPEEELAAFRPADKEEAFIIITPQNEEWAKLIEKVYKERAVKRERYALKKEVGIFDKKKLERAAAGLKPPYEMQLIDKRLYEKILQTEWAADLCAQFKTWEEYERNGLGVAVLKEGEVVSGASSYTYYREGIEIEIDTKKDERQKGLAAACGAALILECLSRKLYPSWDAQNKVSLALAEKLGYHFDKAYPVYEVN